jgi:condensin complex subunit 1
MKYVEGNSTELFGCQEFATFLLTAAKQDKHAKNLAEKLAARLNRCANKRQWDDTAYALSLLQHKNEEITKKVQEGYRVVETEA